MCSRTRIEVPLVLDAALAGQLLLDSIDGEVMRTLKWTAKIERRLAKIVAGEAKLLSVDQRSVFVFDKVPFERRLAETIAWCVPRAHATAPRTSLRSEALRPSLLERDRARMVEAVATYRAQQVRELPIIGGRESLLGGRLLVYFPDDDLADGAADAESQGFFDVHNVPPWDTWVALGDDGPLADVSFQQYVVAWVPPTLIDCAAAGIEVNPEECIAWLEDTAVGARGELRRLLT